MLSSASTRFCGFPCPVANAQVDLRKVNVGVLREWITKRVTEILKIEDDVVIEYAISQIDDADKPVRLPPTAYRYPAPTR
jgi:serine/arginine repetitive matrix protein 1